MPDTVAVPRELLRELREYIDRVEEIVATLEEMTDREGMERIRKASEEYRRGEFRLAETPDEIRKTLETESVD